MVARLTDASAAGLWRAAVGRWQACGFGFEGPVQAFMPAMVGGVGWVTSGSLPSRPPQAESGDSLARAWGATGTP